MIIKGRLNRLSGLLSALFLMFSDGLPLPIRRRGVSPPVVVIFIVFVIVAAAVIAVYLVHFPGAQSTTTTPYP